MLGRQAGSHLEVVGVGPEGWVPLEALSAVVLGDGGGKAVLLNELMALGHCWMDSGGATGEASNNRFPNSRRFPSAMLARLPRANPSRPCRSKTKATYNAHPPVCAGDQKSSGIWGAPLAAPAAGAAGTATPAPLSLPSRSATAQAQRKGEGVWRGDGAWV